MVHVDSLDVGHVGSPAMVPKSPKGTGDKSDMGGNPIREMRSLSELPVERHLDFVFRPPPRLTPRESPLLIFGAEPTLAFMATLE
jgi:hypothetical protein